MILTMIVNWKRRSHHRLPMQYNRQPLMSQLSEPETCNYFIVISLQVGCDVEGIVGVVVDKRGHTADHS